MFRSILSKLLKKKKFFIILFILTIFSKNVLAVTAKEQAQRLQEIYVFLLDYRSLSAPIREDSGKLEVQLEALVMPEVDNQVGTKKEPVDSPPIVPRLRLRYHVPLGFSLGFSGLPGITWDAQKIEFLQFELDWRNNIGSLLYGLRTYYSKWKIEGEITSKEYQDSFYTNTNGFDVRIGYNLDYFIPYLGIGSGNQTFKLFIGEDDVILRGDNKEYQYVFVGTEIRGSEWDFIFEQHKSEDFLLHFQLALRRRF